MLETGGAPGKEFELLLRDQTFADPEHRFRQLGDVRQLLAVALQMGNAAMMLSSAGDTTCSSIGEGWVAGARFYCWFFFAIWLCVFRNVQVFFIKSFFVRSFFVPSRFLFVLLFVWCARPDFLKAQLLHTSTYCSHSC